MLLSEDVRTMSKKKEKHTIEELEGYMSIPGEFKLSEDSLTPLYIHVPMLNGSVCYSVININEVKSNPDNPRTIKDNNFKKLVKSIKDAPWMLNIRPIVVDKNKMVLGGNMRLQACKEAKMEKIPIIIADNINDEQIKEFIIKDNLGFGEWDWEKLANEWDAHDLDDWGLDLPVLAEENDKELDLADEQRYMIIIECNNKREQKKLYEEIEERGFKCKLRT